MSRRRTGCRCWRSTESTRGSRPNSASWKFSSVNRIPPNPSRPSSHPLIAPTISCHHCCRGPPRTSIGLSDTITPGGGLTKANSSNHITVRLHDHHSVRCSHVMDKTKWELQFRVQDVRNSTLKSRLAGNFQTCSNSWNQSFGFGQSFWTCQQSVTGQTN